MFDFPSSPAPTEGQVFTPPGGPTYVFTAGMWRAGTSADSVNEAPSDGKPYARQDGAWVEVPYPETFDDVRDLNAPPSVAGIAFVAGTAAQRGAAIYPGSVNYNVSVDVGAAASGRRIVFGVKGSSQLFSSVWLDSGGVNTAGVLSASAEQPGGGSYAQNGFVDVPAGMAGAKTLRFIKASEQYDSMSVEMWVITGHATGIPKAAHATPVGASSPYNPVVAAGAVAAGDALFVVGQPFAETTGDGFMGISGETIIYADGKDAGAAYGYASGYTLDAVGGTYNAIQHGNGGAPSNNNLGISVMVVAAAA